MSSRFAGPSVLVNKKCVDVMIGFVALFEFCDGLQPSVGVTLVGNCLC